MVPFIHGHRVTNIKGTPTAGVDMIEGLPGVPGAVGTPDVLPRPVVRTDALREGSSTLELSIVIPCLNEARTLPIVVPKALNSLARLGIEGEVIVVDNGSTDDSVAIAERLGARVVHCAKKGYGNALKAGFAAANGKYLLMGDADDSYNFDEIDGFVTYLREGYDLVAGTRLKGRIEKGAMPALHRYLGTPRSHLFAESFLRHAHFRLQLRDAGFDQERVRQAAAGNGGDGVRVRNDHQGGHS